MLFFIKPVLLGSILIWFDVLMPFFLNYPMGQLFYLVSKTIINWKSKRHYFRKTIYWFLFRETPHVSNIKIVNSLIIWLKISKYTILLHYSIGIKASETANKLLHKVGDICFIHFCLRDSICHFMIPFFIDILFKMLVWGGVIYRRRSKSCLCLK